MTDIDGTAIAAGTAAAAANRELVHQIVKAESERDEAIGWADHLSRALLDADRRNCLLDWHLRTIAAFDAWKAAR